MTQKPSMFRTPEGEARFREAYQAALALWPVPFEQQDIPTTFGTTHIIVSGAEDATPVVLLPGMMTSATMWYPIAAELSRRFRIYAVDIIGDLGISVPSRLPTNRADCAGWMVEVIDALGISQTDIIGVSYGGVQALNLAVEAQNRVKHLVLLSPGVSSLGRPTIRWAIYGMPMMMAPSRLSVAWFYRGASVKGYGLDDPVITEIAVGMAALRDRMPYRPEFTEQDFSDYRAPTLLLIGEKEILYKPKLAVQLAKKLIPNVEVEIIPKAGHSLLKDQPELVNARIIQYLTNNSA